IEPLVRHIQIVLDSINDVINKTIAPIFQTIEQVYRQTNALIEAIHNDVKAGISGILQLPGDIAASIGGIEASIQRAVSALSFKAKEGSTVTFDALIDDNLRKQLSALGSLLVNPDFVKP